MKKRKYLFTVTLAVVAAVTVMLSRPSSVGALIFPIVVNNCDGTAVTKTKTLIFPIAVKQGSGTCTGEVSVRTTGQKICYDGSGGTGTVECAGTGQDGELQKGTAWPNPRFTDNNDGTVTDKLSGLVWTANANCTSTTKDWASALTYAQAAGNGECSLADGSSPGDWRLPNIDELLSLVDREYSGPALSNAAGTGKYGTGTDAFTGVKTNNYWTSSTYVASADKAWAVLMNTGESLSLSKPSGAYVWLVRDPK